MAEPDRRLDPPLPRPEPGSVADPTPFNFLGDGGKLRRKRLTKIAEEIERNRRGEYRVPTWVLATCLAVFVAAWVLWILLA